MEYIQLIQKIEELNSLILASQEAQIPPIVESPPANIESSDIKNEEPQNNASTTPTDTQEQELSNEAQLEELTKKKLEYLSKFLKVKFIQLKFSDIEARIAEKEALAKKAAEEEQMNNLQPPGLLQQNQNQNQDDNKKKDKDKGKKGQNGKNGTQDKKQDKDSSNQSSDQNGDKNQNKRRTKLRQRIVNVDPIPIAVNDEPENGPEVYYILYGFTDPQLFDYLSIHDLHVDALIRVEEIPESFVSIPPEVHKSKSEIDISKKIENPLDILDSQSTSNRSKFSKFSLDDQSSLYSYLNNDDKSNYSIKNDQNKMLITEEESKIKENESSNDQPLDIKISSVTWKKTLNPYIIRYKMLTGSNDENSIWKDVVWCDVPFKQKDDPDSIFDQVAVKIYEVLDRKNIYNQFYDNTLIINIPLCDKENNLKYYKYLSEVASYIEPSVSIELWLEILINFSLKTMNLNDPIINIEKIDNIFPYFKILDIPWNKEPEKQEEVKEVKEIKENKNNKDKQTAMENQTKNQQNSSTTSLNGAKNLSILNIQKKTNLNNENKEFLGYSSFDCYFNDIISNISLANTEETIEEKTEGTDINNEDYLSKKKVINYNKYHIIPKDNQYMNNKVLYEKLKIIGININEVYDTFLKFLITNRSLNQIYKEINQCNLNITNNDQDNIDINCPCKSNERNILLRKNELFKSSNFPESILNKALIQYEFESILNMEINDITGSGESVTLDDYCWVEKYDKDTMIQVMEKYKAIYPEVLYKISSFENGTLVIMKSPGPTGCLVSETFEKSQVKNKVNFGLFYEYYDNRKEFLECPELKYIPKKNNEETQDKKILEEQQDIKKNVVSKKKGKKANEKEKEKEKTVTPEKSKTNKKGEKNEKIDKKKNNSPPNIKKSAKTNEVIEPAKEPIAIENEKLPTNYIYNISNDIVQYNDRNLYVYPSDGVIIQIKTINSLTYDSVPQIYYNIISPIATLSYGVNSNDKYMNYLYVNFSDDSTFSFKLSKEGKTNIQFYTNEGILSEYYEDGRIKQKLTSYNKYNIKYQVSDKIELYRIVLPGGKILKVKSTQNYEVYYPNGNITYYDNNGEWTTINEEGKCIQTNSSNEIKELPSLNVFYERLPVPNETKHIRSDMVISRYTDGLHRIVDFPNGIKISSSITKIVDIKDLKSNLNLNASNNIINHQQKLKDFDSLVNVYEFKMHQINVNNYDEEFKINEIINNKYIQYSCESDGFPKTIHYNGGTEIHSIYKSCEIIQYMTVTDEKKLICNKIRILKSGSSIDIFMDGKVCFIPYYNDNLSSSNYSRYNIDIKSEELIINDVTGKDVRIVQNRIYNNDDESNKESGNNNDDINKGSSNDNDNDNKESYNEKKEDINENINENNNVNNNEYNNDSQNNKITNNEDINESTINSQNISKNSINKEAIEAMVYINSNSIASKNHIIESSNNSLLEDYGKQNIENEKKEETKFINNFYKKISTGKLLKYTNLNSDTDNNKDKIDINSKSICGLFNISNINKDVFSLKEDALNNSVIEKLMNTSFTEKILTHGNAPKLFFIYNDGTGIELLRDIDVYHIINEMNINIENDIIEEPLTDNSNGKSIIIVKKLDTNNILLKPDSKILIYKQLNRYPSLTLTDRKQVLDELIYYNNWLEMHNTFMENNCNIIDGIYNNIKIKDKDNEENINDDNTKKIMSNKLFYDNDKEETESEILQKYSELLLRNSIKSSNLELNNNKNIVEEINPNEVSEEHKRRYKILKNIEANEPKSRPVKGILKIDEEIKKSVRESAIFPKYFDTIDPSKIPKEDLNKYKKNDVKKKEWKNTNVMKLTNINSSISIKKKRNNDNKLINDDSKNSSLTSLYCSNSSVSLQNKMNVNNNYNNSNDNNNNISEESKECVSEKYMSNTEIESLDNDLIYKVKPNFDYQIIETGAKRKLKTISTVNESKSLDLLYTEASTNSNTINIKNLEKIYKTKFKYLLNVEPKSCEFGIIKENTKNTMKVSVLNKSNDIVRFKIIQPNSEYIRIKYKIGPVSPGLQIKMIVEVTAPETNSQLSINDFGQIITENEIIKIPISVVILPNKEFNEYNKKQ